MPQTCIVVGCGSRSNRDLVSFYSIPAALNHRFLTHLNVLSSERREKWLAAIKRDDLTETKIKYQKVCSKHFISGKPSGLEDKNNPDWVPTQKMGHVSKIISKSESDVQRFNRAKKRKSNVSEKSSSPLDIVEIPESSDQDAETGVCVQTDLTGNDIDNQAQDFILLSEKLSAMRLELNKLSLDEESFHNDNEKTLFYTGITYPLLKIILKRIDRPCHINSKLNSFQQLLLTLMKLRLNLSFKFLSYQFGISPSTVSSCFEKTISILYSKFKSLIIWPDIEVRRKNIPSCFREVFHDKTTVIIDCFEVVIQKPSNLLSRQQCWSNYKHNYTVKFLIGITPQGTISYISNAWGGRISDKQITQYSNFLDNINPRDIILADRGFLIKDMVGISQANLVIPAFTKGKNQLHPVDIEETRQIAHVRIHVERIIGVIKTKFQIFHEVIPTSMLSNISNNQSILDKIVTVCCALINLSPPLIPL